ncbi:MAG: hypothetical protein H6732_17655 [Alphaproteobacteria bacterium]|nr:hypothetical protein [Alphaproteobacteria bacterium]
MAGRTYDKLLLLGLVAMFADGSRGRATPVAASAPPPVRTWRDALAVTVVPPSPPRHRWPAELVGQVTLQVELALAELEGVVPRVAGQELRPGLRDAVVPGAPPWVVTLGLEARDTRLSVRAELCDPQATCWTQEVEALQAAPEGPLVSLAGWVGAHLGRPATAGMGDLAQRGTTDPYAALIGGRSAATWLGLLPGPSPEAEGDPRRDPIARAVHLDPRLTVGWVALERSRRDSLQREPAARTVRAHWPRSVVALADHAAELAAAGEVEQASAAWQEVGRRARGDPRFVVPRMRVALAVEEPARARTARAELDGAWVDAPGLAEAEVALAEALGTVSEAQLERWARLDTVDPEPVRRRVDLLARQGRAAEALELLPQLAARGRREQAARLTVGLASSLGRWEVAAAAARELGADEAASRLSAAGGDAADLQLLQGSEAPEARLVQAARLARRSRPAEAREVLAELLVNEPWWPEALALAAEVSEALGDHAAAAEARKQLAFADPTFPGAAW